MPLKEIDRDVEVLTASALLSRLWHIEADIKYMKENIEDLDNSYHDVETNLDVIEANATNTKHNFVGHTRSILDRLGIIEERLNAMDKRLDGKLHGDDVRNHRYYKLEEDYQRQLSKCAVTQANIKAIQEKLNAID